MWLFTLRRSSLLSLWKSKSQSVTFYAQTQKISSGLYIYSLFRRYSRFYLGIGSGGKSKQTGSNTICLRLLNFPRYLVSPSSLHSYEDTNVRVPAEFKARGSKKVSRRCVNSKKYKIFLRFFWFLKYKVTDVGTF